MSNKDFTEEFHRIFGLYSANPSFLFGKAGDGELMAIENVNLDNNEFQNNQNVPQARRDELLESLRFKHDNFYLGIMCPCCCNYDGRSGRMKVLSGQNENHLTYANIFVNSNYVLYKEHFIKSYKEKDVWLVCHEASKIENLPFKPERVYPIKKNAWVESYNTIHKIQSESPADKLILFAAGPFGNILGYNLFKSHPNNRMIDVGSTLNPWLQSEGFKRDYYVNTNTGFGARKCQWN